MAAQRGAYDVLIQLGISGLTRVVAAFQRLRSAATTVSAGIGAGVARITSAARLAATSIGTIGLAAAGLTAATLGGFIAGLTKARGIAQQVSEELQATATRARGAGIDDPIRFGGLFFAAQNAGIEDEPTLVGAIAGLQAALIEVKNGSEGALTAFEALNASYEDFFDEQGNILDGATIFRNLARLIDALPDDRNVAEALLPILGETDAFEFARFFELGSDAIEEYIKEYERLTNITPLDFQLSEQFKKTELAQEAAFKGLRVAFSRGLFPDLSESNRQFTEFAIDVREEAEEIGRRVGAAFLAVTPAITEIGRTFFAVFSGNAETLEASPLRDFFLGLEEIIQGISRGAKEFFDFIRTGETDAEWINNLVAIFTTLSDILDSGVKLFGAFAGVYTQTLKPAIDATIDALGDFFELIGLDREFGNIALLGIIATLAGGISGFADVVTGAVKLLIKFGEGLFKAGKAVIDAVNTIRNGGQAAASLLSTEAAAAAGFATLGIGVGAAAFSADALAKEVDKATKEAERLAETQGEAYAAAYLKTFLETVPQEFQGAKFANLFAKLYEKLPGVEDFSADFEGAKAALQIVIDEGSAQDALQGMTKALADYGIELDPLGLYELEVSLNIVGARFEGIDGRFDDLNELLGISVPSIPTSDPIAAAPQAPQTVINLQLPNGNSVETVTSDAAAQALLEQYRRSQRSQL